MDDEKWNSSMEKLVSTIKKLIQTRNSIENSITGSIKIPSQNATDGQLKVSNEINDKKTFIFNYLYRNRNPTHYFEI